MESSSQSSSEPASRLTGDCWAELPTAAIYSASFFWTTCKNLDGVHTTERRSTEGWSLSAGGCSTMTFIMSIHWSSLPITLEQSVLWPASSTLENLSLRQSSNCALNLPSLQCRMFYSKLRRPGRLGLSLCTPMASARPMTPVMPKTSRLQHLCFPDQEDHLQAFMPQDKLNLFIHVFNVI
ncbi:hypothetical protein AOLI_G00084160 [Acnodon oligacanthus]